MASSVSSNDKRLTSRSQNGDRTAFFGTGPGGNQQRQQSGDERNRRHQRSDASDLDWLA